MVQPQSERNSTVRPDRGRLLRDRLLGVTLPTSLGWRRADATFGVRHQIGGGDSGSMQANLENLPRVFTKALTADRVAAGQGPCRRVAIGYWNERNLCR
jgi:hypothetical protein